MTDHPPLPGDELPDDLVELASRYIDGDVDAAERAQVEADPRLVELAARFADMRTELHRPLSVSAEQREDAIAAALAAFDSLDREVAAAPAPTVRSLDAARAARQRRLTRWLGAAAAVAVLAIGGAALTSTIDSDNGGDDSSSEAGRLTAASTVPAHTQQTLEATADADEESATSPAADSSAAADAAAPSAEDPTASTPAGSATTAEAAAETTAAGGTTTTRSAGTVELANEDAVREYVAREEKVSAPSSAPCSDQASGDLSGEPVTYQGKPAVIYVDNDTAIVLNSSTCVPIVTVTLS